MIRGTEDNRSRVIVRAFQASQLSTVEHAVNDYIERRLVKRGVLMRKHSGELLVTASISRESGRWFGLVQATVLRFDSAGNEVDP